MSITIFLFLFCMLLLVGAFAGVQTWAHVVAVAADILTFSIVKGVYDVTISSWCGLEIRKGKAKANWFAWRLGWVLNHISKNHCETAIAADTQRAGMALQYLTNET